MPRSSLPCEQLRAGTPAADASESLLRSLGQELSGVAPTATRRMREEGWPQPLKGVGTTGRGSFAPAAVPLHRLRSSRFSGSLSARYRALPTSPRSPAEDGASGHHTGNEDLQGSATSAQGPLSGATDNGGG